MTGTPSMNTVLAIKTVLLQSCFFLLCAKLPQSTIISGERCNGLTEAILLYRLWNSQHVSLLGEERDVHSDCAQRTAKSTVLG